jgi:hypothetical protein
VYALIINVVSCPPGALIWKIKYLVSCMSGRFLSRCKSSSIKNTGLMRTHVSFSVELWSTLNQYLFFKSDIAIWFMIQVHVSWYLLYRVTGALLVHITDENEKRMDKLGAAVRHVFHVLKIMPTVFYYISQCQIWKINIDSALTITRPKKKHAFALSLCF